jgi:hypothetical protein
LEFGIGTQQIAEIIESEFNAKIQLVESEKANSTNKINEILSS